MEERSELYELDPQKKYLILARNIDLSKLQFPKDYLFPKIPIFLLSDEQSFEIFQVSSNTLIRTEKISPHSLNVLKAFLPDAIIQQKSRQKRIFPEFDNESI